MFKKESFFQNNKKDKKEFSYNLKKTKKAFKTFRFNLDNFKVPQLESYRNDYNYNFDEKIIKKFSNYKNIFIIGMGGSILGAKCIHSFLKNKIKKKVFFFDNLDVDLHLKFFKIKNIRNSCFIVISKSGNTLETIVNFSIIFSKTELKNKLIFITELKNSSLMKIANQLNADVIEHNDLVGGRYSVLSEVGMFPAALMGLNLKKFKNLNKLIKDKKFVNSLIKNVASIYTMNKKNIKNSVMINYDSSLKDLTIWYQQLVAESLGKNGKGITSLLSTAPKDHHSTLQLYLDGPRDKFFTFISTSKNNIDYRISNKIIPTSMKYIKNTSMGSIIKSQCEATKSIFKLKKIPFRHFIFNKINEEELGNIFTFFTLETILLANLMNINPFNQPAVEQIKTETKKILLR
jgi:glucose-6-phosphate isomerase